MFLGYLDDDGSPRHAVLTLGHIVGEAPRPLVAEQGGAVLVGGLLGPRQQRRGLIFVSRLKVLTITPTFCTRVIPPSTRPRVPSDLV